MPPVHVRRTHLALPERAAFRAPAAPAPAGARVERIAPCSTATYRALYAAVGAAWHWHDRDAWPDARLRAHLDDPRVQVWGLRAPDVPREACADGWAGYFELVAHDDAAVEIQYFGLVPGAIGHGLGGFLLERAVDAAWAMGGERVVLNTCTLDAPQALPNYLARGFVFEREEWYEAEIDEARGGARGATTRPS